MALPTVGAGPSAAGPAAYAGPFDGITFAALYGMKRFLSSYTGSLIRLRRDSDDAEADIGYDAVTGLLDTAAVASHLGAANGFVVTWYDQSGNGKDATQATAAAQPAYAATGVNSLPAISFDGSDDGFGVSSFAFTGGVTVIQAYQVEAGGSSYTLFNKTSGNVGRPIDLRGGGINTDWFLAAGGDTGLAGIGTAGTKRILTLITPDGDPTSLYTDGGTPGTGVGTYGADNGNIHIGIRDDGAITWAGYCVAVAVQVGVAITAGQHNTIGNQLGTLYNITWNTVS